MVFGWMIFVGHAHWEGTGATSLCGDLFALLPWHLKKGSSTYDRVLEIRNAVVG
jgi:hypothetical protein